MKRLMISIIFCVVCIIAHATTPYPPKIFVNDNYTFAVGFAWPDQNDKVLIIRTKANTSLYSFDELGLGHSNLEEISTAGFAWCRNSIGYVTSLRIKDKDSERSLRVFYLRHKSGAEVIVDLDSSKLIDSAAVSEKDNLDEKTISRAASLLESEKPRDRQTAAIHLGQLKAKGYLQELTKLLNDDASYTVTSGKETRTVYYVKEAAERAIHLMTTKDNAN
jgi:hypothetical protein